MGLFVFKLLLLNAILILFSCLEIPSAVAERRVALVVGNAAYRHAPELRNPRNDAAEIATVLRSAGVEVLEGIDLDKSTMDRKLREFASALSGADVGIFFYAGHGLQVNGINYLVPVDAELITTTSIEFEMLRMDIVQRIMEGEAKTNILFLDACRNNPLARNLARAMGTRSTTIGTGLASAESGIGTLISFSTQPGNVALDGTGRNSPYALSLARRLPEANKSVSAALIAVRNDVMAATGRKQVPWEHSALTADFYFARRADAATSSGPSYAPQPQTTQTTTQVAPAALAPPPLNGTSDRQLRERIAQYIEWEFLQDKERYAELVDYYDKGRVDRQFIASDKEQYARRWPDRRYILQSGTLEVMVVGSSQYSATFGFTYVVSNGERTIRGTGRTQVRLRSQDGGFLVVAVKASVLSER